MNEHYEQLDYCTLFNRLEYMMLCLINWYIYIFEYVIYWSTKG